MKTFKVDNKLFYYELNESEPGIYQVPFNHPNFNRTESESLEPFINHEKQYFEEDIQNLIPNTLINVNSEQEVLKSLLKVAKNHKVKYGRLLPIDIQKYVSVSVLIMGVIIEEKDKNHINIPLKHRLFDYFIGAVIKWYRN